MNQVRTGFYAVFCRFGGIGFHYSNDVDLSAGLTAEDRFSDDSFPHAWGNWVNNLPSGPASRSALGILAQAGIQWFQRLTGYRVKRACAGLDPVWRYEVEINETAVRKHAGFRSCFSRPLVYAGGFCACNRATSSLRERTLSFLNIV